jgi:hypothetical protein
MNEYAQSAAIDTIRLLRGTRWRPQTLEFIKSLIHAPVMRTTDRVDRGRL